MSGAGPSTDWPELPFDRLRPTADTLQRWTQIVGKVALARTPWLNHSWHVTLRVSARGLATPLIPNGAGGLQLELDFIDHRLVIRSTDGGERRVALAPGTVAGLYAETMDALAGVGAPTRIVAHPNELPDATPFAQDHAPRIYDPAIAQDFWRALVRIHGVFQRFRSGFLGKASPIHFFWGAADLAVTRFSGRRAPLHPGGIPNLPDAVTREAYSHEVSSAGFWAGDERVPAPSFYSYAYPSPPGFAEARVSPPGARFDPALGEFLLPYDVVRRAADPDETLLSFLQSTYEAAADLAGWDRAALECGEGALGRPRSVG
ncbi:MAG TPA: DUF5996 family protein [Caulobacteraceae bacterium]|nr:DUF5996 family protein [Caulobacteraceae bacterium]